jgi:hypothetical protein
VLALAAAVVVAQTPQPGRTATFEVVLKGAHQRNRDRAINGRLADFVNRPARTATDLTTTSSS